MAKTGVKLEKLSKVVLFWTVALIAILTAINYFVSGLGILQYTAPALVFGIALFVFIEVKYFDSFKKRDVFRMGGVIIAMLAMIGVVTELIPQIGTIQFLDTIKGLVSGLLAIYFVVEGLR